MGFLKSQAVSLGLHEKRLEEDPPQPVPGSGPGAAEELPGVSVPGPRQVGKSTLARAMATWCTRGRLTPR